MRILLATDGSSHSQRATRWLLDLALPADVAVTVLTVATLDEPPRDAQTMGELRAAAARKARGVAERAARLLKRRWQHVEVIVREGDPRVEIVHVADDMRIGLIVLGSRGLGRITRFWIGSTSLAVARYASCPVAIVRGRPHKTGRVLVPIDGSDGSRAALRFLSMSELERSSRVTLLHVLPRTVATAPRRSARSLDDRHLGEDERKHHAEAATLLQDAAATLEDSPRRIERLVAHGDAAREIVKIARSRDVDLIILGARGLRTLGRLLLGSVSETVLHQASRPVIIVRE